MAEDPVADWPSEEIPDADALYLRAHRQYWVEGEWLPGIIREHEGGVSVDWEKYATPEETRDRARNPSDNAVALLRAGAVRAIEPLSVIHAPDRERNNRAHSDIRGIGEGPERVERRLKVRRAIESFPIPLVTP